MAKADSRIITTDLEIDAAIARGKVYDQYAPSVVTALYRAESDVIALTLSTGVELAIPRKLLQGLENADPSAVAKMEILGPGSMLHWEALDVDHSLQSLLHGIFGNRRWMSEIGKLGGAARTDAKRSASRKNGRKGGRPKRESVSA